MTGRASLIDRRALLSRLGEVEPEPAEPNPWLTRAGLQDRLPHLLGLDQRSSYELCRRVLDRLRPGWDRP
ncbi:hypothetical protein [Winogradskya humida]|uniref:Uncharacterized protein n=1 Tax=Winogradskya humida TaxID=113566 RepID=A0ABQ4A1E4_9ACTN|nr:hypothetical protein [Actinoplanes humidus]GIE24648.1 hypothetical protein Ahu01nite_077500 [Actinoplanes humidus]